MRKEKNEDQRFLARITGGVAYISEKNVAKLWKRSPNVDFEEILPEGSIQVPVF